MILRLILKKMTIHPQLGETVLHRLRLILFLIVIITGLTDIGYLKDLQR
jgi:hypothetical protein